MFEALMKQAEHARAAKDAVGVVEACRKAAAVYAGSKDSKELDLRHRALSEAGGTLRAAGRRAEAMQQFEENAAAAKAELGPESTPFLLARYFLGLTKQDADDDAGAIAPLRESVSGYVKRAGADQEVGLIGTALGLSLMREHHFAEAVAVLQQSRARLAKLPNQANSLAATLHNLAMSQVRGGDAKGGLATAQEAVALRLKLDGAAHPLTVETQFVEVLARIEAGDAAGASALLRKGALVILQGAGEKHPFFADALLLEGRRQARLGDGPAAEALARRALFIIQQAGIGAAAAKQRHLDAAALGPLWRTAPAAQGPDDVALWRVSMQHTLRRYQPATLDFAGSGDRPKDWFFFVPKSWGLDRATYAARLVFADCNAALNAREPADAHFLDATAAKAVGLTAMPADLPADAAFRARVWEPSIGYSLVRGTTGRPLGVQDFAQAVAAVLGKTADAWLAPLKTDLAPAHADPAGTKQRTLF